MKRFRVTLAGDNLLFDVDGEHRKCGFRATWFVRAIDADQARKSALIRVHQNPILKERLIDAGKILPHIVVESVEEVGAWRFFRGQKRQDLEFFCEDDELLAGQV